MSNECATITNPDQVTPEWLTQVLRQSGHLACCEVTQVCVAVDSSYTSTIAHVGPSYSEDTPAGAPTHLFLKVSRPSAQQRVVGSAQRRAEVEFYNRVVTLMPGAPVVRCYQAIYNAETGASHLLFDDLSTTHSGGISRVPPSQTHCERAIEAFADFHAIWWDNPALPAVAGLPSPASVADDIAGIRACFPSFADAAGSHLTLSQCALYNQTLAALPHLLQRRTRGQHLTLIHGDANLSNVLLPYDAREGRALIIDWQLWGASFAAEDLANLMALFWDKDQRHTMERELLMRYHERLLQRGVRYYTWADCWHDYRLAVIVRILFMPMWFWNSGAPDAMIWLSLERAWQAFDDLDCHSLLDDSSQ